MVFGSKIRPITDICQAILLNGQERYGNNSSVSEHHLIRAASWYRVLIHHHLLDSVRDNNVSFFEVGNLREIGLDQLSSEMKALNVSILQCIQ